MKPCNLRFPALAAAALLASLPAAAQEVTAREVVQPLPSGEVQRLNRALMDLARRPKSLAALVEAGDASLALDDLDAAMGFYGRADDLDPASARVKLGIAAVYLRSGRPVEALEAFAAAEAAGAKPPEFAHDLGLAYDLVGDHEAARAAYEMALEVAPDDHETTRRLALSHAIAGNRAGFEDTLRPLLDRRDHAAFRTRAFGLAILGDQARAAAIVDAVMPRDLAGRITPYLAFMPRLTPAQQAAAANLGIFPRAADIGRENARIASFARDEEGSSGSPRGDAPIASSPRGDARAARLAREDEAGRRLEPAGEPLGARPGFDLASPSSSPASPPSAPPRVAEAFTDLAGGGLPAGTSRGDAVDLSAIEIPRERPPAPEKPAHPKRVWVQVATGQDLSALRFDWRRIARAADGVLGGFEPHTVRWGRANRLLAGPVEDGAKAREMVNALKAKGLDSFTYTSPEGTEIRPLG